MHAQLALLRDSPGFRWLVLARLGSGLGTWLAFFALTVTVFERTQSANWVSALVVADLLPATLIGLALGHVVDRYDRRRVMIATDLVGYEIFALLPLVDSTVALIALAGVASAATALFRPAAYAAVPNLVRDEDVVPANAVMQSAENATTFVAPLIGGAIVAAAGTDVAFWVNAGSFLVSAGLVYLIPGHRLHGAAEVQPVTTGYVHELRRGVALVRGNPILRTILASWGLVTVTIGAINVTQVVIAKEAYETGDLGFGFFVGAEAVGIVLGNVVAPALIARLGTRRSYAVGFGVMALGVVGAAASPGIVPATVAAAVHGVGNGIGLVTNLSLLQRAVTDDMRGRAFAFMGSVLSVTALAGMIAAGPITEWAGSRALWNGLGVTLAFVAVAVLAARALQHGDEAPTPSPAPADGAPQADEAGRS